MVYGEPIQPSLFTGASGSPSEPEDLQPYGPIYTAPTVLPKSDKVALEEVFTGKYSRDL